MCEPEGWARDNLGAALSILGHASADPAGFLEQKYDFGDAREVHFTGYFETELHASLSEQPGFQVPLYGMPDIDPMPSRAEIVAGALHDRAEVLAWLRDPLDAFLLQVQGSGVLILSDGSRIGIGYAGKNGHPYKSIGQELLARGVQPPMSLTKIRSYCTQNPKLVEDLLNTNPSYVFFALRDAGSGPIGAMGVPVSKLRSIAVDPEFIPLGSPAWVDVLIDGTRYQRLMIAQDIGSAIKGPNRADIFCGTGAEAGLIAGGLNTTGKLIPLLPKR